MVKFCPECGKEQHDDSVKYCSNCGFDFSKVESNMESDSVVNVHISSDNDPVSKPKSSENNHVDVPISPEKNSVSKPVSSSNTKSTSSTYSNSKPKVNQSNDFLSSLTFNKCFAAFALLLIILLIIGLIGESTDTEPYSDGGLTSFMQSSSYDYDLPSYLEGSDYYYGDPEDDYYRYGGDGEATNLKHY